MRSKEMKSKGIDNVSEVSVTEVAPSELCDHRFNQTSKLFVVTVDSGKDSTKAKQGGVTKQFKTRVARQSELNHVSPSEGAFVVTYDGEAFVVGDDVNIQPDLEISKTTIEHKICIYSAIAQLVPNGAIVNLVIGIPVLLFLDEKDRADYVAFMSQPEDQEWIEITLNGEPHYFKLNKVKALPESSGYIFSHDEECVDELVGVIDIGGLNINGCIYSQLNPVHKSCFTLNNGGHHLKRDIQQKLIQQLKRDIQDYQMDYILRKPSKAEAPIIKGVIDRYISLMLNEMRKKNWDISEEGIQVVLTGGTSKIIGPYASDYFPRLVLSKEPVFDNVKGFQVYADAFLGE